jgi:hypothetical protein
MTVTGTYQEKEYGIRKAKLCGSVTAIDIRKSHCGKSKRGDVCHPDITTATDRLCVLPVLFGVRSVISALLLRVARRTSCAWCRLNRALPWDLRSALTG